MKVQLGPLITSATGRLDSVVFSSRKSGDVVVTHRPSVQPNTTAQQNVKTSIARGSDVWQLVEDARAVPGATLSANMVSAWQNFNPRQKAPVRSKFVGSYSRQVLKTPAFEDVLLLKGRVGIPRPLSITSVSATVNSLTVSIKTGLRAPNFFNSDFGVRLLVFAVEHFTPLSSSRISNRLIYLNEVENVAVDTTYEVTLTPPITHRRWISSIGFGAAIFFRNDKDRGKLTFSDSIQGSVII